MVIPKALTVPNALTFTTGIDLTPLHQHHASNIEHVTQNLLVHPFHQRSSRFQVAMRLFRRRGSDSAPQLVSLAPLQKDEGGDPEDPAAPTLIKPSAVLHVRRRPTPQR